MELVKYPNDCLTTKASSVEEVDEAVIELVKQLYIILDEKQAHGVAAPQIGVGQRVFVYDDYAGNRGELINPLITLSDGGTNTATEGCLSLPGFTLAVPRANEIYIVGTNLRGEPMTHQAQGLLARIFQHEVDHLNGSLIIDLVSREVRRAALKKVK